MANLPVRQHIEPIARIITDLDQSDEPIKSSRKSNRNQEKKLFKNQSVNFTGRSKSAENRLELKLKKGSAPSSSNPNISRGKEDIGYFKLLVKTKDDQIEKLVEKISELHNYNNEFAQENNRLQNELRTFVESVETINKKLEEAENRECSFCLNWETEKTELNTTNKCLEDDVMMMKNLVYRLNVQLERYQDKIRKSCVSAGNSTTRQVTDSPLLGQQDHDRPLTWGPVNTDTLGPLLNAYDEMIREKEDLILEYEKEMSRFSGHLKDILEENERLQGEIDEIRKGHEGWLEEKTKLEAQLDVCRNKAELQTKKADMAKDKLVDVLRCYEQKVQAQSLELDRLQEAYSRTKAELVGLKSSQAIQPNTISDSLKECQRLFEELKSEHGNEKIKMNTDLTESKKHIVELEREVFDLRNTNSSLKLTREKEQETLEELKKKNLALKEHSRHLKESRDRLKARLRMALQWAQKLEQSRDQVKNTWDQLRELEALVRHKEAQIRGLQCRHLEEMDKLQKRLEQRDETIRNILKDKVKVF